MRKPCIIYRDGGVTDSIAGAPKDKHTVEGAPTLKNPP